MTDDEKRMQGLLRAARMPASDDLEKFNSGGFNVHAASQEEANAREEAARAHARAEIDRARRELDLFHDMRSITDSDMSWFRNRILRANALDGAERQRLLSASQDDYRSEHGREAPGGLLRVLASVEFPLPPQREVPAHQTPDESRIGERDQRWLADVVAAGRLCKRGEITQDAYLAVVNKAAIHDDIRAKLEQEVLRGPPVQAT